MASTEFAFRLQETYSRFNEESVGFGPFVVQRKQIVDNIVKNAGPHRSVHISGCKGAGKTTVLHLVGKVLAERGVKLYLFESSSEFNREDVIRWVKEMARSKEEVYLLVDETQDNPGAALFTLLLKNNMRHKITTIGAGVPDFPTVSGTFKHRITTDRLFVTEPMLSSEGIIDYFSSPNPVEIDSSKMGVDPPAGEGTAATTGGESTTEPAAKSNQLNEEGKAGEDKKHETTTAPPAEETTANPKRDDIAELLKFLRMHVGGHVYPLMALAELLVPLILDKGASVDAAIAYFESVEFRQQQPFCDVILRILPDVTVTDVRPLLSKVRDPQTVKDLQKKGFCDIRGKIISAFLFGAFIQAQRGAL